VAVGLAAGAWLGGRRPVVVMQNSGLGTSLNALASLSLMYGLPALLLVTWRGYQGKDAPEHILMGEISPGLLDLLGIPYRVLSPDRSRNTWPGPLASSTRARSRSRSSCRPGSWSLPRRRTTPGPQAPRDDRPLPGAGSGDRRTGRAGGATPRNLAPPGPSPRH
jgi:hypothetical protein